MASGNVSCLLLLLCWLAVGADSPSRALFSHLFSNYSREVTPLPSDGGPVHINASFYVSTIADVVERDQVVVIKGWVKLTWVDEALQWEPLLFGNLSVINVDNSRLWLPDIVFYNSASAFFFDTIDYLKTRVYSDGTVELEPGGTLHMSCDLDLFIFPFDHHQCHMEVTPWSYTAQEIWMNASELQLSPDAFRPNPQWDVSRLWWKSLYYESDNGEFTEARFIYHLRRRPLYHLVNTLFPVSVLSVVNLFVFLLPSSDGEKITFSCGLLLAYSVWLVTISAHLPVDSRRIPLIGVYVVVVMVLSGLYIVVTVWVIHVSCLPDKDAVPAWLQRSVLRLRRCCRPRVSNHVEKVSSVQLTWQEVSRAMDLLAFAVFLSVNVLVVALMSAYLAVQRGSEPVPNVQP